MKVALYARVSTTDKEQNPETQLLALRKFCSNAGYDIVEEYVDQARARDYANRVAWKKLQADARQHKFQMVLVFRLDRAFRSSKECLNLVSEWSERGISFKSISQDVIDTSTSMGNFMLQIMSAVAELESSIIGDRVRAGISRVREEGGSWGRKPFNKPFTEVCEALQRVGNVRLAAEGLGVSVPYLYKVLKPKGLNPSEVARGKRKKE